MTRTQRFTFWFCLWAPLVILAVDAVLWDVGGVEATISGLFRQLSLQFGWFKWVVGVAMFLLWLHWFGQEYLDYFFPED